MDSLIDGCSGRRQESAPDVGHQRTLLAAPVKPLSQTTKKWRELRVPASSIACRAASPSFATLRFSTGVKARRAVDASTRCYSNALRLFWTSRAATMATEAAGSLLEQLRVAFQDLVR